MNILSFDQIKSNISGRDVYIWGARIMGLNVFHTLTREGISPKGFMDADHKLQGTKILNVPVFSPESMLARPAGEIFIFLSNDFFIEEMKSTCVQRGLVEGRDFVAGTHFKQYSTYFIEVAGMCNLRCLGCGHGNWPIKRRGGMMSPEVYGKVLEKILSEDPGTGCISLYNWGEPMLNPQLPEIITITADHGLQAAISSNLNHVLRLEEVVKSKPLFFRISASGYGKNYEQTHAGGKWNVFYKNLHTLVDLWKRHHPDMIVEINYHIYKDRKDDYYLMKDLCEKLGIGLRSGFGVLFPYDAINCFLRNQPLSEEALQLIALSAFPLDEGVALLKGKADLHCPCNENNVAIDWDGSVCHCPNWYDPTIPVLAESFFDISIQEIKRIRRSHAFCAECKKMGLPRWFSTINDSRLSEGFLNSAAIRK